MHIKTMNALVKLIIDRVNANAIKQYFRILCRKQKILNNAPTYPVIGGFFFFKKKGK